MKRPAGTVWLIGAGPGDPELLTLKAVRALGAADAVLLDDLVDRAVLRHARADVQVIEVGKRGGCRSTPQAFIERKLIQLARQGLTVARVKGGDPYVFGRGGEEVEALARAGIACEVVPGIPAGVAAPAAAGIPVTHREHCHGVTFVTAHTRGDREPNWDALAHSGTTLVIYMGVARAAQVAVGLSVGGLAPATAVAIIENATRPEMRTVVTRLDRLAQDAVAQQIVSPAVIVVGEVVHCAALARQAARRAA